MPFIPTPNLEYVHALDEFVRVKPTPKAKPKSFLPKDACERMAELTDKALGMLRDWGRGDTFVGCAVVLIAKRPYLRLRWRLVTPGDVKTLHRRDPHFHRLWTGTLNDPNGVAEFIEEPKPEPEPKGT